MQTLLVAIHSGNCSETNRVLIRVQTLLVAIHGGNCVYKGANDLNKHSTKTRIVYNVFKVFGHGKSTLQGHLSPRVIISL